MTDRLVEKGWMKKSLKEKGLKATWKQFKYNFKLYDPVDAVTDQIVSCSLFILGWILALVYSIQNHQYWLMVMAIGGLLMFQSNLRQNIKQREILNEIKKQEMEYMKDGYKV